MPRRSAEIKKGKPSPNSFFAPPWCSTYVRQLQRMCIHLYNKFNIIKGDMSIIGPRPKLVKDVIFYSDDVKSLMVRPGITGLAQVNGRNNNTWDSMFVFDKIYVEKMSLGLDTKIFFKTFSEVLKRTGVNSGETNYQDYYYGDYLLRVGKISQEEYDQKMQRAKRIVDKFVASRKFRKVFTMVKRKQEEEEFDLEHKLID